MRRAARTDSTQRDISTISVTERDFTRTVLALARVKGWMIYHTFMSIHSAPGFPDLVLVRPPRVVFAELKTDKGKVSDAQTEWLDSLKDCPGVECRVWRPEDWHNIMATLEAL